MRHSSPWPSKPSPSSIPRSFASACVPSSCRQRWRQRSQGLQHWAALIASGKADAFKETALLPEFITEVKKLRGKKQPRTAATDAVCWAVTLSLQAMGRHGDGQVGRGVPTAPSWQAEGLRSCGMVEQKSFGLTRRARGSPPYPACGVPPMIQPLGVERI
jgi:hypothetical protein